MFGFGISFKDPASCLETQRIVKMQEEQIRLLLEKIQLEKEIAEVYKQQTVDLKCHIQKLEDLLEEIINKLKNKQ
jgi:hypothetical protein